MGDSAILDASDNPQNRARAQAITMTIMTQCQVEDDSIIADLRPRASFARFVFPLLCRMTWRKSSLLFGIYDADLPTHDSGLNSDIAGCPKSADFVAKVENRTTRKISPKLIFGLLCRCVAFQRR